VTKVSQVRSAVPSGQSLAARPAYQRGTGVSTMSSWRVKRIDQDLCAQPREKSSSDSSAPSTDHARHRRQHRHTASSCGPPKRPAVPDREEGGLRIAAVVCGLAARRIRTGGNGPGVGSAYTYTYVGEARRWPGPWQARGAGIRIAAGASPWQVGLQDGMTDERRGIRDTRSHANRARGRYVQPTGVPCSIADGDQFLW
jgi:hypothetical protein